MTSRPPRAADARAIGLPTNTPPTLQTAPRRILVTGGGTFLGDAIAAALLAEGAEVTLLVRQGTEENLGLLRERVRWFVADVWDPASLKGRGRGHQVVIHTVGGMIADPARGLTYDWLNLVSARNIATMCMSAGVPQMVLLSAARAPWVSRSYIRAKREAELYMERIGLQARVIRAPIVYVRGARRHPFYRLMTLLGGLPPFSWLGLSQIAPMPIDVLARGVARLVMEGRSTRTIYTASDLRRRNSRRERRRGGLPDAVDPNGIEPTSTPPLTLMGDDARFGWTPNERE